MRNSERIQTAAEGQCRYVGLCQGWEPENTVWGSRVTSWQKRVKVSELLPGLAGERQGRRPQYNRLLPFPDSSPLLIP